MKAPSLQERLNKLEPLVPLVLCLHGTILLLLMHRGAFWAWAAVLGTGLLGLWGLSGWRNFEQAILVRVTILYLLTWSLLLVTGGVGSFFLLWLFVIFSVYPLLLARKPALVFLICAILCYLLLLPLSTALLPLVVVLSRLFLLLFIGGLTRLLGLTIASYYAERNKTEQALRESEERYRTLVEQAAVGIFIADPQGKFLDVNTRGCQMLAYTHQEILQQSLADIVAPSSQANVRLLLDELVVGETTITEWQLHRKDGISIATEISTQQLSDGWILGIVRDITDRKSTEEALERNEAYFRSLIENALDIITILNRDGTMRYGSPSLERLLGYHPEELIGQSIREFIHPNDLPTAQKSFQEHSQVAGPMPAVEVRFRHKDGTWRVLETTSTNLLDDPIVRGVVTNSRNITERKQLEEQFRQAQKMEAIGQLTAGIAHDFNNLLIPIHGYAELMQLRMPPNDPHQKSVEKILHSAQRAANLVRQLLAFSRKQVIAPQLLNLNSTVTETDKLLRRTIGEDVNLQTNLAPDLWTVKVDPTQIEQIIINLVVNARDAMPTGGDLTIETANVRLDDAYMADHLAMQIDGEAARAGDYVRLTIRDTGLGMSEEVQAHIFEPFFTTKEPGKGTGMGLATIYGIVGQNGGQIGVDSRPGIGTAFEIYLPCTNERLPSSAFLATEAEMPSGDETILLVEDDAEVRDLVLQVLQNQGHQLLAATNGEEALQLAAQYTGFIHLLLTDVIMPGMSGKVLADQLAQSRPELKILYMSGYNDDIIAPHGVLDEGTFLLQKPFGHIVLARKVREVLDS